MALGAAGPAPAPFLAHRDVANRGAAAAVPLLHTYNNLEEKKFKKSNIGFSVQIRVHFFPSVISQPWEWVSKIGFIAPFHLNGKTRQQMLEHWEEFSQRLKLNLKEEQLSALSVLRQLSKEKSRFWKRSDLFDDFVISVLNSDYFICALK